MGCYRQLKELQESQGEALKSLSLETEKNSLLTSEMGQLRGELEKARVELAKLHQYKADEGKRRAEEKKAFLESKEFFTLLGHRVVSIFEYGFDGAIQQFKEAQLTRPKESLLLFSI